MRIQQFSNMDGARVGKFFIAVGHLVLKEQESAAPMWKLDDWDLAQVVAAYFDALPVEGDISIGRVRIMIEQIPEASGD